MNEAEILADFTHKLEQMCELLKFEKPEEVSGKIARGKFFYNVRIGDMWIKRWVWARGDVAMDMMSDCVSVLLLNRTEEVQ